MNDDQILKKAEAIKEKLAIKEDIKRLTNLLDNKDWELECEVTGKRKGVMKFLVSWRNFHYESIKALIKKEIQIRKAKS